MDGENYTEVTVDEQTLKALTGSTVTATPNSYTGFTFDVTSVDTGTVLADGSLVINLYYKRNTYTITIKSFGEVIDTVEFLFGEEISLDDLEETGFDFDGWVEQLPETMPAENLTVNAKWTAIEVNYTVKHFLQDLDGENYTEVTTDRQTLKALTGSTVIATSNEYEGFTFDVNSEVEGTVLADGTLVIELFYTRNKYTFTIMDGAEVYYSEVLYFEQFLDYPYPEKAGYTWGGFEEGLISNMPAEDLTLNLIWHANEQTYYVKHYIEQIDGTYVLFYTETLTAYTDEVVEADYISIPNHIFKEDHPDNVLSGIIPATGNLELSVYYEIISVTLSFNPNGGTSVDPITAKVEEKVELPTPTRTGYTFVAWLDEIGNEVDLEDGLFTIPSMNCTLSAKWEVIEYSIEYYFYVGSTLYDGAFNNPNANKYTIEYGVNLLEPDGFDSEYFFVAWYTDLDFKEEVTGIETGSTGTKVFYGLLKSYAEAFEEDIDILLDTYSEVLAGTVTTLEPLTLTLPNGTVVSWQSDDTAIYVNPLTGEVTITRPTDADHIVVITAMLTLGDHYYNVEFVVVVPKGATYVEEVLYSTGFENAGTKNGYAQGTVKIDEVDWTLTEVLIGSDSNDAKEGSKSLRGRPTGTATLLEAFENVSKIAFKYATYGSDSGVKIQLQISKDGEDWVSVFEVTPSKHILEEANVVIDYNNSSISSKGITASTALNIRFYITGTSGKRVNIDDFSIYSLVEVNPDVALINEDLGNIPSQFENVIDVFTLPTIGANGSTIVWSVLNGNAVTIEDNVVTDVTRPASNQEDAVVTLLATVSLNGLERTKEVTVTVLKLEKTNADKLAEDKAALEALSGEIFAGATFNLIETTTNGASVTWFANPSNLIDEEGVVGAGLVENAVLTLTATLTLGEDEVTAVVTLEILAQIEYGTVEEARAITEGEEVRVKGVVTTLIGNNAFIQDETGGIYIYLGSNSSYADKLVVGNLVGVIGTRAVYSTLQQVSNPTHVEILGTEEVPEAIEFTAIDREAFVELEGQLVTIKNVTLSAKNISGSGSFNITVKDSANNTLDLRIDLGIADFAAVKSHFQAMVIGQKLNLLDVPMGKYNGNPQIMISSVEQVQLVELSDADKLELAAAELTDFGTQTGVFDLPLTGLYGSVIEWTVLYGTSVTIEDSVVTNVNRPTDEDEVVTLLARLTLGSDEKTKTVIVTITKEVESGGGEPRQLRFDFARYNSNITTSNGYADKTFTLEGINFLWEAASKQGATISDTIITDTSKTSHLGTAYIEMHTSVGFNITSVSVSLQGWSSSDMDNFKYAGIEYLNGTEWVKANTDSFGLTTTKETFTVQINASNVTSVRVVIESKSTTSSARLRVGLYDLTLNGISN